MDLFLETVSSGGRRVVLSHKDLGLVSAAISLLETLMLCLGEFDKLPISKHFSNDFFIIKTPKALNHGWWAWSGCCFKHE
jgi:hypothetical protein